VLLAGCSGGVVTDAVDLSRHGKEAAAAAEQASVASAAEYAGYRRSEIFRHAFVGLQSPTDLFALEDKNQAELAARARVFASLANTYAALGSLAGYNAPQAFEGDLSDLFANVNAFQQIVKGPQIGARTESLVKPVLGAVGGWIQSEKIIKASDQIRAQVENIIAIMSDPEYRTQFVETKKMIVAESGGTAALLMQRGLLSPKPVIEEMGAPFGLAVSENFRDVLGRDEMARRGISAVAQYRQKLAADAVETSYDAALKALKELLPLHDRLRAGQALDFAQLNETVRQLQTVAAAIDSSLGKGGSK
jgi:hypothetical protein